MTNEEKVSYSPTTQKFKVDPEKYQNLDDNTKLELLSVFNQLQISKTYKQLSKTLPTYLAFSIFLACFVVCISLLVVAYTVAMKTDKTSPTSYVVDPKAPTNSTAGRFLQPSQQDLTVPLQRSLEGTVNSTQVPGPVS
jgi:hypothetical protein